MRAILAIPIILIAGLTLGACQHDREEAETPVVEKPDWWPERGDNPLDPGGGIDWPPPRPDGYDGAWPPDESLDWWLRHYRASQQDAGGDPTDEDNIEDAGHEGSYKFAHGFRPLDREGRPQCGNFALTRAASAQAPSCTPFPARLTATLCRNVLDVASARQACERACGTNEDECRDGFLFEPAAHAFWRCGTALDLDDTVAYCDATFICQCFEG